MTTPDESVITPHEAAVVLYWFQPGMGGYPPSGGISSLLNAIAAVDSDHKDRIALGFPGLVAAFRVGQEVKDGLRILKAIAGAA